MKFQLFRLRPLILSSTACASTGWKFSFLVASEDAVKPTCPSMTVTELLPKRILLLALTRAPLPLAWLKWPVALLKSAPPPMAGLDELMETPGSDITGVAPPEETNGAVAVTAVTTDPGTSLETPMEPSWISAPVSDPSKTLAPVTALSARLTVVTQPIHFFSECPPGGSSFGGSPFGGAF